MNITLIAKISPMFKYKFIGNPKKTPLDYPLIIVLLIYAFFSKGLEKYFVLMLTTLKLKNRGFCRINNFVNTKSKSYTLNF